jgi:hypothetical protein
MSFAIRELVDRNAGNELELHGRTINPQFLHMLRTIDFDRHWPAARVPICTTPRYPVRSIFALSAHTHTPRRARGRWGR